MAIWTPSEGESPRFGVSGGTVFARAQGSPTLASMPRTANAGARRNFVSWTNSAPWQARWQALDTTTRDAWTAHAAANDFYGLTGQPARIDAASYFARYWAQASLFQNAEPAPPWLPTAVPVFPGDNKPFEPFLDPLDAMAIVTRIEHSTDTDYFFASMPPTRGQTRLVRSACRPLGTFTLPACAAGTHWPDPSAAAVAAFGASALDVSCQQWLLAWLVLDGYPQPVLDPCWSPPPPPTHYPCDCAAGGWPDQTFLAVDTRASDPGNTDQGGTATLVWNGFSQWTGSYLPSGGGGSTSVGLRCDTGNFYCQMIGDGGGFSPPSYFCSLMPPHPGCVPTGSYNWVESYIWQRNRFIVTIAPA